jgi:hypothetical protein
VSASGKIIINIDGISDGERATAKFQSAYADMMTQLSAPGFAHVLCAHEAAHALYFTIAGTKQFEPQTARIRFDPTINDYAGHLAAVQILDLPNWMPGKFAEWFSMVARAHAAGGVVARKLMPWSDGGDQDDRKRLKDLCDELNKDSNIHINFEDVWKQAQESVAKDLEIPEWMAEIEKQAEILRPQFGL